MDCNLAVQAVRDALEKKDEELAALRSLLAKYIGHVVHSEGVDFLRHSERPIEDDTRYRHVDKFSDEEWSTLRSLAGYDPEDE